MNTDKTTNTYRRLLAFIGRELYFSHVLKERLPRSTFSRAASGNSLHGTSSGTPKPEACFFKSVNHERYLGRFQGSIAPSLRLRPLSGITRFKSKSTVFPNKGLS